MARNYRSRDPVYVVTSSGTGNFNYGFNTGLKTDKRSNFGQTAIDFNSVPDKTAFGVNSPKPARASKKETSGYESSWCSDDKIASLKASGYKVIPGRRRFGGNSALSQTLYVTIQGIKYAWISPLLPSFVPATDLAELGVKQASAGDKDLIFGASQPKPSRFKKDFTQGETSGSFSIFIDPAQEDNAIAKGWTRAKGLILL
ncbi:hypothetical protein [Mastigocoleus testarum]|uniref:Uncharacterized protein n=1 Tax=Mastigocoleus testarum BC008 TaxID=371196 RepID=A0A0V7ZK18_9CYAN|nr:hypothetical protein [Mastigocoleus testarum]KST64076.1 hypothetical protein BC008_40495 [Mastigocoleus testarum BC008]KST64786.1 hypothetical protein BC008_41470 [Mastigocoleus testarum BC008]